MSGEIDNDDYPNEDKTQTLDEMIEQLPEPARATLRQCLKQRDDAMGDQPELKADYDAELMAMLRSGQ